MKFIRTVKVKHVLTEKKKQEIISDFEEEVTQLNRELEQLEFQLHKATKDLQAREQQNVRARYKAEMRKRKDKLETVSFRVQQLQKLETGSELDAGTADMILDIDIGDPWPDDTDSVEVIVKDGRVQEFKESRTSDDDNLV
ncbi:YlqD family protein [Shouchella shacheensis]|uniref:YlqD family protein n=1 Tax=Shouchella shacheensis TaxID=1649580 RepID=UPI00073FEA2D|nr:YlqD family protein [Shouchella shacheensis]